MNIERSYSQTRTEFANTNSTKARMLMGALKTSHEYRQAFVEEALQTRITAQIRALRNKHGLDYKGFADRIDKSVSWTYRLEDPNAAPPTIPTLLRIANKFDIGLDVRFRSFSVRLRFSELIQVPDEDNPTWENQHGIQLERVAVTLPWHQAKYLRDMLDGLIRNYETLNGELKSVRLPGRPGTDSGGEM